MPCFTILRAFFHKSKDFKQAECFTLSTLVGIKHYVMCATNNHSMQDSARLIINPYFPCILHLTLGTFRPTLQWFKDNIPINPSNRRTPRGGMLMLKELAVQDTGLYTCRVTTELGTKTSESNIKVLGKKFVYTDGCLWFVRNEIFYQSPR